ncbi:beta strand repeat-containing protein [Deinococcus kurensis]|uniref:beta strand repeat-containing protein n=1 Tax=Deinococcus kurensis TaxID=2662757 RepID=UPI0012D31411|nr:Ig-like domain-containing protein [Deinococcus kurensis]
MKTARNPLLLLLTGTLVACGGGTTPAATNTPPSVSVKSDGRAITTSTYLRSGSAVQIAATDPDVGGSITKVTYAIDGGARVSLTPAASITLPVGNLRGGQHELAVDATDNQNATTSIKVPFLIDAAAPTITQLTLNGQAAAATTTYTVGDAVLLDIAARDTRGDAANTAGPVTAIRVYENGSLVKSGSGGTLNVDLSKTAAGAARAAGTSVITVEVEDSVGYVTTRTLTLTFNAATDNGGAVAPTFTWLSPASDFVKGGGSVTLRATATRNGQDLSSQIVYTATCGTISGNVWTLGADCADGSKQSVTATVTDGGRSFSSPARVITVDASDPTVQITSPQQGQSFTQNPIKISVTGTDAVSGLDRILVEASRDGGASYTQVGVVTAASGEVTWAPMNGTYTLRATATDKTGRTSSSTLDGIKVNLTSSDATPPAVTLAPLPTTPQRATVTVTATATDADSGIAKVDLYDGGTLITSNATGINGKYTFSVDTTKFSDGTHTLRAVAFDNAGLSSETSVTLTVDNTAPAVNWVSPADGAITGGTVTLNATTNEGTVTYTVDGTTLSGNTVTFQRDGAHTITATATDAAGNRTVNSIRVTSDATKPTAQITSPTQNQMFTSSPVSISVIGQDGETGLANIKVYANDGVTDELISTLAAAGTVTWYPRKTDGTPYTIRAVATDRAGNTSDAAQVGNIQAKTASKLIASPAVTITPPAAAPRGSTYSANARLYVRGPLTVQATATTDAPSLTQAELQIDGQTLTSTTTAPGTPTFNFDFDTLNEGLHDVGVRFTDSVGTTGISKTSVYVDKTAPVITWNAPASGALSNTDVTLSATAQDNASGVKGSVTYTESGQPITSPVTSEGLHTVTATATDNVDNVATRTVSFTIDKTAPVVVPGLPATTQEFNTAPVTLTATATDNLSGVASMELLVGQSGQPLTTLGQQNGASYSAVFTPTQTGTYDVRYVARDVAGNVTSSVTRSFRYSVTTAPAEQAPAPVLDVVGSAPFSGNMAVNVSGNFDAASQVDRMILQITDSKGVVDNSTYVTTQARATFSVDTTRFANGPLKLQVIAYTKTGLRGLSGETSVQVQNLTSPDFRVVSPSDGATVNTPSVPVQLTLTKRSADYTITQPIQVELLDYRGVTVAQTTFSTTDSAVCSGNTESLTCTTSFDVAALPADTYIIRARTTVQVDPAGANVTRLLETSSRFTHNTVSVLPPASTIRFPAITETQKPGQLDSLSGVLISVSDNTGVKVVEARVVGPFDATRPLTLNGTTQCADSLPVTGRAPVDVLLLNYGYDTPILSGNVVLGNLDIDGSAYVPDNNPNERYDLRVTVQDTEGNRNIQCIPVTINRAAIRAARPTYNLSTVKEASTVSGALNYTAGTWQLAGAANRSRAAALLYFNGIQQNISFNNDFTGSVSYKIAFGDPGTYQVVWLVEDMTTGIVTSVAGEVVSVTRNP